MVPAMNPPAGASAASEPIPLGQRLFDNIFLLLGAGLVVVFVLYTGWGIWEIMHLPPATLP
jgi:F0F1-type ATP synthase membrane subunit a